jgi:hypothetical protein
MGWIDTILLGSITSKLLEVSENHPLWLVDGKGWKSRRVLIAIDETPRAIELARYEGRMLQGNPFKAPARGLRNSGTGS